MVLVDRVGRSSGEAGVEADAPSDAELIASGNAEVFAQLYDRYVDGIYRYCRLRLPQAADAEDATALTFTKAFAAFPPAPTGSFRSWLFTIAHNVVVNHYRSRKTRGPTRSLDDALHLADPAQTPEEATLLADEHLTLIRALAQLPEDQRRVVELRLAGLSGAEIAETLGRSGAAVRQLQFRAMQRLREILIDPNAPTSEEGRHVR